jgi:uncharacterized protein (DUF2062 family)
MKTLKLNPIPAILQKLRAINADPMMICYGYAFGTFMCTTPLIGIKWIVALPILWLTKWNKVACMIGIFQVNYLTGPLFYALAYFVGNGVCGYHNAVGLPEKMSFIAMKDLFLGNANVFVSLLVGGLVLSIPLTISAFYLVKSILNRKVTSQLS